MYYCNIPKQGNIQALIEPEAWPLQLWALFLKRPDILSGNATFGKKNFDGQ